MVQALETVGLVGLIISGFITCIALFKRQDKMMKVINIVFALGSGVLIAIGVLVFAVKCNEDEGSFCSYVDSADSYDNYITLKPSISFFLCTIAGSLCIIALLPLLLVDLCTASSQSEQQLQSTPVQYQSQMSPATGQVIIGDNIQQPLPPPVYSPPIQEDLFEKGFNKI